MTTTRSTAEERRLKAGTLRNARVQTRSPEGVLLVSASVVALLGLFLVYRARTYGFTGLEQQLKSKKLLNLNAVSGRAELIPFLTVFDHPADRQFAASKILGHLRDSPSTPNVGALAKIRLAAKEVDSTRGLDVFRKRLAQLRENHPTRAPNPDITFPLLTLAQFNQLKPLLVVRHPDEFRSRFWLHVILYLAGFYVLHALWKIKALGGDPFLLPLVHVLTGLGLIAMVSLRDPLRDTLSLAPFAQGVMLGCALMLALSFLDYQSLLAKLSFVPLLLSFLFSVVLILWGSGPGTSDAKVNLFGFQPVEVVKILLVFFLAGYFADRWELLRELKEKRYNLPFVLRGIALPPLRYVLPVLIGTGLALLFFFFQRDLGPALIMSCSLLVFYAIARNRLPAVILGLLIMLAGFWGGYRLGYPHTVAERIQMWLSPWDNTVRGGDQLAHSLWSLASGGFSGTGLGLGDPGIVPAAHTDLILSVYGEELGFLGLLSIFALYASLVYRGVLIALKAPSDYTFFLSLGLTLLMALPVLLISGGLLGLFPLSGIVSPFLSYGRTSMLAHFVMVAILISISSRAATVEQSQPFERPVRWLLRSLAALALVIAVRAAYLQIIRADATLIAGALSVQADGARRYQYNPRLAEIARQIPRGAIYDRNGIPLATSHWEELQKHRGQYLKLGVYLDEVTVRSERRHYPFTGRTFHLLGDWRTRANWAASNTSFEERDSNRRLQGYDDRARVVELKGPRDDKPIRVLKHDYSELIPLLRHRYQPEHESVKQILSRQRDLRLSVDIRLQLRVAEILQNHLQRQNKDKGAAVVLAPDTGGLLASVTYPYPQGSGPIGSSQTPDDVSERTGEAMLDRARYGLYPPGSTFKLVTAMAALRSNPGILEETFQCQTLPDGRVGNLVRGWPRPIRDDIQDKTAHGTVNLEKGIIVSCNAYFAQMATYLLGPEALHGTADLLGIRVAAPNTPKQLRSALPQAAYGQGQVVATPFQMARVAATLANGGSMPFGRWVTYDSNPRMQEPQAVLSREQSERLAQFMRAVVTHGTGRRLSSAQPPVAGKTGTAEIQDAPSHAWFIGFAPYGGSQRRIAFSVLVEHGRYGGIVAAPIAGEIVAAARELGIIP
ncbi:MAG: FtsW/RodA/SpoVE family cell cycle protein [Acidobacteria bacterium]|nr:FtsW/RodA/SpoVE family cell cycle protein [Acidobacteriota bacterium]MCI0626685.1 FtsW/RodA/SpoVE family cell cycle protein [Acidobacteriota bacterium]MCI0721372.1 FtsW/RodA/SpoVE family cell cycle protein [Acidobacteriota bacterium]